MVKSLSERISILEKLFTRGGRITAEDLFWASVGDRGGIDRIRKLFPKISHVARQGLRLAAIAHENRSPWESRMARYKIIQMIPHLRPGELMAIRIVLDGGLGKLEELKEAKFLLR